MRAEQQSREEMTNGTGRDRKNGDSLTEYRLGEIKALVTQEFNRINRHLDRQDDKINDLNIWRAGIETRTLNINNGLSSKDLGKIILAIIGALTLALTILAQVVK